MKVTFLGTSAAPSMPIPYCTCNVCSQARQIRGKNLRRRSSILVNDDLLVDIGPDTATASFEYGVELAGVSICLLTHSHEDHFDPEFLMCRHLEYGTVLATNLIIAASMRTLEAIDEILGRRCEYGSIFGEDTQRSLSIAVEPLEPFESYTLGAYSVTPYPANHGREREASVYAIRRNQQAILYSTDTSVLSDTFWDHLARQSIRFDAVILDHTYGPGFESTPYGHLASEDVADYAGRLHREGLLTEIGTIYATHISHEGCLEHDELDRYAARNGYRIAFDGLTLNLAG